MYAPEQSRPKKDSDDLFQQFSLSAMSAPQSQSPAPMAEKVSPAPSTNTPADQIEQLVLQLKFILVC